MTQNSRWRKTSVAVVLAAFVLVVQAGLMAQNLGTAPQVNVAVQGEQATQPEGTFLNLINWIGNVIAPVGAGGAALMAIGSFRRWPRIRQMGVHGNRTAVGFRRNPICSNTGLPKARLESLKPAFGGRGPG